MELSSPDLKPGKNFFARKWPLLTSLTVLSLTILVLLFISMRQNDGKLIYSFDDAYIHMAIAKNLSQHGVWGVTKYEFTSSSSSLFWTSSLAAVNFAAGPNEITPFVINLLSAYLLLFLIYLVFEKEGVKPLFIFISLIFLIFLIHLPSLIFTGLEHVTHVLVSVLFIYYASGLVADTKKNFRDSFFLVLLALLLPALRYEGLVSVLAVSALLLIGRKWLLSLLVFLSGTIPIFIFGLISVSKGWSFFPNSLLMKASFPDIMTLSDFTGFAYGMLSKVFTPFNIVIIVIILISFIIGFLYYKKGKIKINKIIIRDLTLAFLFIINAFLYYIFSKTGWTYRYQSFLVAMAIFIAPLVFFKNTMHETGSRSDSKFKTKLHILGYVFLAACLVFQGMERFNTIISTPRATTNIYQQQYQTARFIARFYNGKEIGLNDIGTTSYLADIKLVDMWGLANLEISKMRRQGVYLKNEIREVARQRDLKIAIIYDSWFIEEGESIIPEEWIKVGEWRISDNIAAADDVVSVYAVDPSEKNNLIQNLKTHSPDMPRQVIQSGLYTMNRENSGIK